MAALAATLLCVTLHLLVAPSAEGFDHVHPGPMFDKPPGPGKDEPNARNTGDEVSVVEPQGQHETGMIDSNKERVPCKDDIKVNLTQDLPVDVQPSGYASLWCFFDRNGSQALTVAFYSGTNMVMVQEYVSNMVIWKTPEVYSWSFPHDGYWAWIQYTLPACHREEDFSCHVVDRMKCDGQDSSPVVFLASPQIYYDGVCLTCYGPREVVFEEAMNITLTCNVTNVRPEVKLIWDEPLTLIPGGEISTPRSDCDGLYFDQSSTVTALVDKSRHWHLCCIADSTHEIGERLLSSIVTFMPREPKTRIHKSTYIIHGKGNGAN